ncbi:MAG: hypothetical protein HKM88_04665 [Halobacteria archaeon]|nr:hypothetical protein [Halobacteria archaeon]
MRLVLAALVALLGLTACQVGLDVRAGGTLFHALSGAEFILHKNITIAPGRVRVIFQEGVLAHAASEFEPHCELEVRKIREEPQSVPAGSYRIGKVRGDIHYVRHPQNKLMLAALGDMTLASDSSSEWYMYAYHMTLHSELHQEAPILICGGAFNYPFYADYPGMQEIQEALGDYATLRLN